VLKTASHPSGPVVVYPCPRLLPLETSLTLTYPASGPSALATALVFPRGPITP
jgi:hypothetical protein